MIHVKDKELVVPGQVLAEEGYYSGRGTFKDGTSVFSSLIGLVSLRNKKISVIPLKSKYVPKKGDVVIGEIDDIRFSMWGVDINSPYSGILPASEVFGRERKELSRVFNIGDALFLRVVDVDEVKKVKLGLKGRGMGKFRGGILVDITPTKVPRLIGKKGSMINMIKDKTKCKIVVGQNGLVWVKGEKPMEQITKNIIKLIEAEAHTSGLTNRIRDKLYLFVDGKVPEKQENEFEITADDLKSVDNNNIDKNIGVGDRDGNSNLNDTEFKSIKKNLDSNESTDVLEKPRLENIREEVEAEIDALKVVNGVGHDNAESHDSKDINAANSETIDKPKVHKINYLDAFNHLKNKSNDEQSGLGEINKGENSSPTLNVSNSSNSIEKKDNSIKPVTSWRKKS